MQRRGFMRLVGGGTIVATVGTALAACSSDYPAGAVAAWNGPARDADLRRWALGYAILAPSPHNRQPWLVDLREADAITLHVDRDRLLPETDPWFRQIMIGQGTFIEALVIALRERGVAPTVTLFPQGEFKPREVDDRPVARITWAAGNGAANDPLFAQLTRRRTAKIDYDTTRPVAPAQLDALRTALVDPGIAYAGTVDPTRVAVLRTLCMDAARAELTTPRTVVESLQLIRVGPAEIERDRDGISINTPLVRLIDAVGGLDRRHPPAEGSAAYRQMMERFEGHSRSAMGFVWLSTDTARHAAGGTTRSAEVDAGRAYMRLQLKATELGLQMHPMSQAPEEFAEMRPHHEQLHRLLVDAPAARRTVQMFCRVGYGGEAPHTPRRGVDAIVRA